MRSWQSFLVEWLIKIIIKQVNPVTYLEQKRIDNENPYVIPAKLKQKYNIKKSKSYLIDTYMLKSLSKSDSRQILFLREGDILSSY
jgi:hypothetical protein